MTAPSAVSRLSLGNPTHVIAITVAVVVTAAAGWVGIQARQANAELGKTRADLQRANDQLATVRQQFKSPTTTESAALIAEAGRVQALGVADEDRLTLIDSVGRLAEANGLAQVRVTSVPRNDSLFLPARTIGKRTLPPASYDLSVEFEGGFAGVVKFVNSLPPSVSVSRFLAARRDAKTVYEMTLSIYLLDASQPR